MSTERRTDILSLTYDWKPELFQKMRLLVNISQMSEKFTFEGPKSFIILSIFWRAVIEVNLRFTNLN